MSDREERLLTLAMFLERIEPDRFVMLWGIPRLPSKRRGSVACALGWAASIPAFKAEGLCAKQGPDGHVLVFKHKEGLEAAQEFFGLTFEETWTTLTPDGYPERNVTASTVAKRLRLLAGKGQQ